MIEEVYAKDLRDGNIILGRYGRKAAIIEVIIDLSADISEGVEMNYRYLDEKHVRFCTLHGKRKIKREVPACG